MIRDYGKNGGPTPRKFAVASLLSLKQGCAPACGTLIAVQYGSSSRAVDDAKPLPLPLALAPPLPKSITIYLCSSSDNLQPGPRLLVALSS